LSRLWTEKEIEILKTMIGKFSVEEICDVLKNRTAGGIRIKAYGLGLALFEPEIDLEYYAKLMKVKKG